MSQLGKRIIVLAMFWVFLVMIFTQVYDNVTGRGMPVPQAAEAEAGQTAVIPNPAITLLAEMQACVAADPTNLDCTLELADLYFINKQWPQSQTNYERAVKLDPNNMLAWRRLASTIMYQGQFSDAVPALQRAGELDPRSAEIQLLLGLALSRVDPPRAIEAVAAWRRVLEIAPDTEWARQAAAYIQETQR